MIYMGLARCILATSILLSSTLNAKEVQAKPIVAIDGTIVETGVIFSSRISEANGLCRRPNICWLPTPLEIAALEERLPTYLRSSGERGASDISKNLKSYKRKYFGYENMGKRWILIIGLCSKYWQSATPAFQSVKRPMTDMGCCYFSTEYNATDMKFMDIYVDGEA